MLASEYKYQKVGGLGTHVVGLAPRLGDLLPLDLIVPRYHGHGPRQEPVGRLGMVYRVDADKPLPGHDFDKQVWRMNDRLNAFISERIEAGVRYDIIHAHDWLSGYVANDLHRRYGIPLVATIHATESGRVGGWYQSSALSERIHLAECHLAREANRIIACSEFMCEEIVEVLGVDASKIVVTPNGVESGPLVGLRRQRQAWLHERRQWAAEDEPLIFFVGRLVWQKGPDLIVAAIAKLREHFPGIRAVVAGHGAYLDDLRSQIFSLNLQEHVHLPGFIADEVRDKLYALADVAVFPSRYEPFGIVALEAMAAGIPVIVSKVGGLREVVVDGVTGLCVEPGRSDVLASAITEILSHPDSALERARQAQEVVVSQYHWSTIANQTLRVYESTERQGSAR